MLSSNSIKYIKSLQHKKFRKEYGLFVAEGSRLVDDIISSELIVDSIFHTEEWEPTRLAQEIKCELISGKEMSRISGLTTPSSVLAIVKTPHAKPNLSNLEKSFTLALDDIQDPGNLGTIIRLADWFGIETIICSPATADAFSPKVVQSSMGAIARVEIVYTDLEDVLEYAVKRGIAVYGAFLEGENIYTATLDNYGIAVMGNEGNGISGKVGKLIPNRITIPSFAGKGRGSESLNVAMATAVICSEFRRRSIG